MELEEDEDFEDGGGVLDDDEFGNDLDDDGYNSAKGEY
jgi:hypothetical protein